MDEVEQSYTRGFISKLSAFTQSKSGLGYFNSKKLSPSGSNKGSNNPLKPIGPIKPTANKLPNVPGAP